MGRVIIVVAVAAIFLMPAAHGQAVDDSGREAFQKASTYFEAEEYETALPFFQMAYRLSARKPATILALAQCLRAMKRYDEALGYFREYLAVKPRPKNADEVQETVALVERLILMEGPTRAPDKASSPPPSAEPSASLAPIPQPDPSPPPDHVASSSVATSLIASAPEEQHDQSILSSPWLWIAAGVAVVGGGVAIAIAASSGGENLYGGNAGLVFRP